MTQDSTINPYQTPISDIEVARQASGIVFSSAKKLTGGDGNRFITDAWGIYKKAPVKWTVITLLVFILVMLISLIPLIGSLIGSVLFIPIFAGLYVGAEALTKGESLHFSHIFSAFKLRGLKLLGFSIVYSVLYVLSFAVPLFLMGATDILPMFFGGDPDPEKFAQMGENFVLIILMVMAFAILLMMAYWFAIPLITFQDDGIFQALGKSFKANLKNIWPMTIYGIMMTIWLFLSIIPIGLGLLIMMPVITISVYTGYRRIFTE